MKNDIEIVRGTTNVFNLTITDFNGEPFSLTATGQKLIFGIKREVDDTDYIVLKTIAEYNSEDYDGVYNFSFRVEAQDTMNLPFGRYIYDISMQYGNAFYNIIEPSEFKISKNVTKWGCAD